MLKQIVAKGVLGLSVLALIFIFNYFVRIDLAWRLKSAEARGDRPQSASIVHSEETHPVVNMEEETYIVYSDLDGDGDLDIAYTTNSPIRFIENKTIDRRAR